MDDCHWAVSPVHHALTHGAQEKPGKTTAAASTHDDEAGVLALTYQRLDREPTDAVAADFDVGVLLLPAGQ